MGREHEPGVLPSFTGQESFLGASADREPDRVGFAPVRHRTKVTKSAASPAAGLAMAFKLIESAQDRWRCVNAPRLVDPVRTGATIINGKLVERREEVQHEAA